MTHGAQETRRNIAHGAASGHPAIEQKNGGVAIAQQDVCRCMKGRQQVSTSSDSKLAALPWSPLLCAGSQRRLRRARSGDRDIGM